MKTKEFFSHISRIAVDSAALILVSTGLVGCDKPRVVWPSSFPEGVAGFTPNNAFDKNGCVDVFIAAAQHASGDTAKIAVTGGATFDVTRDPVDVLRTRACPPHGKPVELTVTRGGKSSSKQIFP
jgi:hypothetical protein